MGGNGMRRLAAVAVAAASIVPMSAFTRAPLVVSAAPPPTVAYTTTSGTLTATGLGPSSNATCSVVYDIYVPADASASHKVPLVLSTNGFGGSKADQASVSQLFAS